MAATRPNYNQAFDAPGYAALQDALETDVFDVRQKLEVIEKMLKIAVTPSTPPALPSYTGGDFAYEGKNYTFNKPAQQVPGFGYVNFNEVAAAPATFAALLDYMIANQLPALEEVV